MGMMGMLMGSNGGADGDDGGAEEGVSDDRDSPGIRDSWTRCFPPLGWRMGPLFSSFFS